MKLKIILLLFPIVSLYTIQMNAQWLTNGDNIYNSNAGNVGIGIAPTHKLHIQQSLSGGEVVPLLIQNNNASPASGDAVTVRIASTYSPDGQANGIVNLTGSRTSSGSMDFNFLLSPGSAAAPVSRFFMQGETGNVGIGLISPTHKLHIQQSLPGGEVVPLLIQNYNASPVSGDAVTVRIASSYSPDAQANGIINLTGSRTASGSMDLNFSLSPGSVGSPVSRLFLQGETGYVGIGIINPKNLLDVNGTVHAREVKVDITGWSDFVFHPTYQLKPLTAVEQYIQVNGHLENIPSAADVEQDGVNVGEMQRKLLEKVEETTLYIIEQAKQIEALKKENKQLKEDGKNQLIEQNNTNMELHQLIIEMKKEIETLKNK